MWLPQYTSMALTPLMCTILNGVLTDYDKQVARLKPATTISKAYGKKSTSIVWIEWSVILISRSKMPISKKTMFISSWIVWMTDLTRLAVMFFRWLCWAGICFCLTRRSPTSYHDGYSSADRSWFGCHGNSLTSQPHLKSLTGRPGQTTSSVAMSLQMQSYAMVLGSSVRLTT